MRHGEANHNVTGTINAEPNSTSSITKAGLAQARKLADKLANEPIEAIFVSAFDRTKQTASALQQRIDAPLIIDPDINELRIGFEGEPLTNWKQARRKSSNPWTYKKTGAESLANGVERAERFITKLRETTYGTVAIVTHGFMVVAIRSLIEGDSVKELYEAGDPGAEISHDEVIELTLN